MTSPKQRPNLWPGLIALGVGAAIFFGLMAVGFPLDQLLPGAGLAFFVVGLAILVRLGVSDASVNQPRGARLAAALRGTFIVIMGVSFLVVGPWLRVILGLAGLLILVLQIVAENRPVRTTAGS